MSADKPQKPPQKTQGTQFVRLVLKTVLLLILFNLLFAWSYPLPFLGKISAYNSLFPGRTRLPYGDDPSLSYNLNLYNLNAMFASHEIHGTPKSENEYRVILIGDSATWGFLLSPEHTASNLINEKKLILEDGRQITAYNLGYPVMSLTKDLLIIERALDYQPDLIVWAITLESFPYDKQLFPPLLQNNLDKVLGLNQEYNLNLDPLTGDLKQPGFYDRTILGARRSLADLVWLQFYGVMWAATGIDQYIPSSFEPAMQDLPGDLSFHNLEPPDLAPSDVASNILMAGFEVADDTPILLVNEPMLISQGKNSDLRYNFFYPRWAYDDYRNWLHKTSLELGWHYLDLWDSIPYQEFTNSAVHLSPIGSQMYADLLSTSIQEIAQELMDH